MLTTKTVKYGGGGLFVSGRFLNEGSMDERYVGFSPAALKGGGGLRLQGFRVTGFKLPRGPSAP